MHYIEKVADRVINGKDTEWNMNMEHWDWVPGVGLYGICRGATVYAACDTYVEAWLKRNIEKSTLQLTVNSTAPYLGMLYSYERTGNEEYLQRCTRMADWILNEAPKTVDGGLEHTVTEGVVFHDQMWADTLFMVCIFMSRIGKVLGRQDFKDFASKQLELHFKFLQNPGTGLCYHGWDGAQRNHLSGCYWGRANAWIMAAAPEILENVGEFSNKDTVIKCYRALAEALRKHQTGEGGIRTLVDDETAYIETSATAGYAYGILRAVKMGLLDADYTSAAELAREYVLTQIKEDGSVVGVSGGTPIMKDAQAYKDIPTSTTLYGQGLTLLMLCE